MKEARIQLNLRMTTSLKEKLKQQADEMGTSMREIIEHRIKDLPIIDNRSKKERFEAIHALCKEINYIYDIL